MSSSLIIYFVLHHPDSASSQVQDQANQGLIGEGLIVSWWSELSLSLELLEALWSWRCWIESRPNPTIQTFPPCQYLWKGLSPSTAAFWQCQELSRLEKTSEMIQSDLPLLIHGTLRYLRSPAFPSPRKLWFEEMDTGSSLLMIPESTSGKSSLETPLFSNEKHLLELSRRRTHGNTLFFSGFPLIFGSFKWQNGAQQTLYLVSPHPVSYGWGKDGPASWKILELWNGLGWKRPWKGHS